MIWRSPRSLLEEAIETLALPTPLSPEDQRRAAVFIAQRGLLGASSLRVVLRILGFKPEDLSDSEIQLIWSRYHHPAAPPWAR